MFVTTRTGTSKRGTTMIIMTALVYLSSLYTGLKAEPLPIKLPEELLTVYGPIAPICFLRFTGEDEKKETLDLKHDNCIKHKQPYLQSALDRGFLGYTLKRTNPSMRNAGIFYRYLGTIEKKGVRQYYFLLHYTGGGSGFFSHLIRLKLKNNVLSFSKYIAGGDRCFGGIDEAEIKDGVLSYKEKLTPHMMVEVGQEKHVDGYSVLTLDDCAVCCVGSLLMKDESIIGFEFNGILPETEKANRQQLCYNSFIQSAGAESKATLNREKFLSLQQNIMRTCIR